MEIVDKYDLHENDENLRVLMKHNSLIKAKYNLTLVQNRVFELLLYKFQKEKDGILSCEVHRNEFKELIKKEKDRTIKGVSDLLDSLRVKEILISEKINGKNKYKWHRFGLINGSIYNEDTDTFTIKATEEIYALIRNYYDKKEGHTPVNLLVKLSMNNYYAQRLYDLIRVWSGSKHIITYEVEELKELLQIEDKYTLYADFKRRVINPAIKELNKTELFEISIKENKVGRKVVSIDFIVKDLDKRIYWRDKSINKISCVDNNIIENNKYDKKEVENNKSFYIPDETYFTKGTKDRLIKDFENIDFTNSYMKNAFDDAIMITLEKDDVEKIKATSYKYFKGCLENKIKEYKHEEELDIKDREETEKYW